MLDAGKRIIMNKNNMSHNETLMENAITNNCAQPQKVAYEMIGEVHTLGDRAYISYGIAAYVDAEMSEAKRVIAHVSDISLNCSILEPLIQRCNTLGISPMHLVDVVEDFLNS